MKHLFCTVPAVSLTEAPLVSMGALLPLSLVCGALVGTLVSADVGVLVGGALVGTGALVFTVIKVGKSESGLT
jgi:hypothetical protein